MDKVVDEAAVNQKLVYAQVTYTNNTDAEMKKYFISWQPGDNQT